MATIVDYNRIPGYATTLSRTWLWMFPEWSGGSRNWSGLGTQAARNNIPLTNWQYQSRGYETNKSNCTVVSWRVLVEPKCQMCIDPIFPKQSLVHEWGLQGFAGIWRLKDYCRKELWNVTSDLAMLISCDIPSKLYNYADAPQHLITGIIFLHHVEPC